MNDHRGVLEEALMAESIVFHVGIDLHKESVSLAVFKGAEQEAEREVTLPTDWTRLRRIFERLLERGAVKACYEAGGCGFGLCRKLREMGVDCVVIAPSHIPVRPGDRRKTDQGDARKLARNLRNGELVAVHVPGPAEEQVRDLVRSRMVLVREVHRSRQYVLKMLLRLGLVFEGGKKHWTKVHRQWLRTLRLEGEQQKVLERYLSLLQSKELMLEEIEADVKRIAEQEPYVRPVGRLRCLRGLDTVAAMVLVTEVVDVLRFATARDFMGWVGLSVSENSSGGPDKQRMGGITKTGNARCRFVLGQAAWSYAHPPRLSAALLKRQEGQPQEVVDYARRAQRRLCRRFDALRMRKNSTVAATAVARELAGFVWALLRDEKDKLLPRRRLSA